MKLSKIVKPFLIVAVFAHGLVGTAVGQNKWVATWATSPQADADESVVKVDEFRFGTLRQIVHLSVGGTRMRIRLSNRYGSGPLHLIVVHVAKATGSGSPKIVTATDATVRFSGKEDVIIPAGADYFSDPVDFSVPALSDLAITLRVDPASQKLTGHPGSRATSFLEPRDALSAEDLPDARKITRWYFLAEVDVEAPANAYSIVALGDSITDGHGATTDGNDRWPDVLAKRLQANAATKKIGVANQGIGGNRLLLDGIAANVLARFDHDALSQAGVKWVIVLEGINDLGMLTHEKEVTDEEHAEEVRRIEGAYEQIIARAHAQGIKVIGGTLTPFVGSGFYHPNEKNEVDRQAVNEWIRKHFDAVVDFDKVVRDPEHAERFKAEFDCGDHLHPSPAGFAAMADAIPLSLFVN
jgi:lysophospholipase L1-like esterase